MNRLAFAAALALVATAVAAQPVRCVDASGKVRYVDASQAGKDKCTPVGNRLEVVPAPPSTRGRAQPPATDTGAQARDAAQAQLMAAEKRLAEAKKALAEQEGIRGGDEKNYQRVLDRLKPYQEAVENAQKDVDQARRDLR